MKEKLLTLHNKLINAIRKYPGLLRLLPIISIGIIMQILAIKQSIDPIIIIPDDTISQVLATSAEVIAGLYGLILTGYIFFLDHLQVQVNDNELLEDVILLLKKRYNRIVVLLSINCYLVIILAIGLLLYGTNNNLLTTTTYNFIVNETILLVFTAITLIIYFVLVLVDPDKITKASTEYKRLLNGSDKENGNLQDFLNDYEEINQILIEKSQALALENIGRNPLRNHNIKEFLELRKIINDALWKNLTRIHKYYNYMIISGELTVSKEICELTKEVKEELVKR